MTGTIIKLPVPDAALGGCPRCGRVSGYVNLARDHWAYCDLHRYAWCFGSNLFSGWREESDAIWQRNAAFLSGYKVSG